MKGIKQLLLLIPVLMALFVSPIKAEEIDNSQEGSLFFEIHDHDGNPVPGGTFTIYHVGDIVEGEDPHFELDQEFAGSNADLSDPENRQVIAYLQDYSSKHNIQGLTEKVPDNAIVEFKTIPFGLYLVVQHEPAPGYHPMTSFLISVPNWNKETGKYDYRVNATPKADPAKYRSPEPGPGPKSPPSNQPPAHTSVDSAVWQGSGILLISGLFLILLSRRVRRVDER